MCSVSMFRSMFSLFGVIFVETRGQENTKDQCFNDSDFLDSTKIDQEMRRVFEVCHGCRRCFNLCDSFPKLFELIDESKKEEVSSVSSNQFPKVVDACTLCDMCFMTKCPYVPPHEFNIDFPHLMLRYRAFQRNNGQLHKVPMQLAQTDRNGKIGIFFSKIINWFTNKNNKFFRIVLEKIFGIFQSRNNNRRSNNFSRFKIFMRLHNFF